MTDQPQPSHGVTTHLAGQALREAPGASDHHERLFARIAGRVFRYFHKLVRGRDEAEDLAHDTFLRLERSLREQTYDPKRSFNTWVWIKAHSVYVDWVRRRERKPTVSLEEPERIASPATASAEHVNQRLDAEALLVALEAELGSETYEVFVLYYQGGISLTEVGEVLGRNRKTVADRIRAAHRFLDQRLA